MGISGNVGRGAVARLVAILALALVAFVLTSPAYAAPCECKDIKAIKSRIKEVERYLESYRKVLVACYSDNPPRNIEEFVRLFDQYTWGGDRPDNIKTAGTVTSSFGTQVTDEMKAQYCDSVITAVKEIHESDHNQYRLVNALPMLAGVAYGHPMMAMLRNIAISEARAHEVEKAYLEKELERIRAGCRRIRVEHTMKKVFECTVKGSGWLRFNDAQQVSCEGQPWCLVKLDLNCSGQKNSASGPVTFKSSGEIIYRFSGSKNDTALQLEVGMDPASTGGMEIKGGRYNYSVPFVYGLYAPEGLILDDVDGATASVSTKLGRHEFTLERP